MDAYNDLAKGRGIYPDFALEDTAAEVACRRYEGPWFVAGCLREWISCEGAAMVGEMSSTHPAV